MTKKHLFKIPLEFSDLFVRELCFTTNKIVYQIRDNLTGIAKEPERIDKFNIEDGKIWFEKSRNIDLNLAKYVSSILSS